MEWYILVLKKFADFHSRSRRKEFWMFVLFNMIAGFIAGLIDGILGTEFLAPLYSLIVFIPGVAVGFRRLHDTGRSGWWLLLSFIPIIGTIVLIIFFIQDSEPHTNKYGENPKGESLVEIQ